MRKGGRGKESYREKDVSQWGGEEEKANERRIRRPILRMMNIQNIERPICLGLLNDYCCTIRLQVTRLLSARRGSFQERVTIPRTCLPTSGTLLRVGTDQNELIGTETTVSLDSNRRPLLCAFSDSLCGLYLRSSEHSPNKASASRTLLASPHLQSLLPPTHHKNNAALDESQKKQFLNSTNTETYSVSMNARACLTSPTDRMSRAWKTSIPSASSGPSRRLGFCAMATLFLVLEMRVLYALRCWLVSVVRSIPTEIVFNLTRIYTYDSMAILRRNLSARNIADARR